jgi:hypothetical protein
VCLNLLELRPHIRRARSVVSHLLSTSSELIAMRSLRTDALWL